jgi:uncharacterized protein
MTVLPGKGSMRRGSSRKCRSLEPKSRINQLSIAVKNCRFPARINFDDMLGSTPKVAQRSHKKKLNVVLHQAISLCSCKRVSAFRIRNSVISNNNVSTRKEILFIGRMSDQEIQRCTIMSHCASGHLDQETVANGCFRWMLVVVPKRAGARCQNCGQEN